MPTDGRCTASDAGLRAAGNLPAVPDDLLRMVDKYNFIHISTDFRRPVAVPAAMCQSVLYAPIGRTVRQSHMARQRGHHGYLGNGHRRIPAVGQPFGTAFRGADLARGHARGLRAHPERRDPLDHRLFVLADDVYGCGGWTTTICAAASSLMGDLITECRRFMKGTASVVRKYGMTVWLYDLVNDASKALFVGEPSNRTPLLIHPVPAQELGETLRAERQTTVRQQARTEVGHA